MREIQTNYQKLIERIQNCKGYNSRIKLIAVSKFKSASAMLEVYRLGHKLFGENRVQEIKEKSSKLPQDSELHFIGSLQTNKAKYLPQLVTTIHSLDSLKVAQILDKKCLQLNKKLSVLLQSNICQETTKSGVKNYQQLITLATEIVKLKQLNLVGLMTIPAVTLTDKETAKVYSQLRQQKEKLAAELQITLPELSMGMSSDFEIAIAEGATYLRIGSTIFGNR